MSTNTIESTDSATRSLGRRSVMLLLVSLLLAVGVSAGAAVAPPGSPVERATGVVGLSASEADAAASTCSLGRKGWICMHLFGESTSVREVAVWGTQAGRICNPSAWVYVVTPQGRVYGLDYKSRTGCSWWGGFDYFTFKWGKFAYSGKYVPDGSRVCVKLMDSGNSLGGEPCVRIKK